MKNVREVPKTWIQERGQQKGFKFTLITEARRVKLYEVLDGDTKHYEVVKTRLTPARPHKYKSHEGYDLIERLPSSDRWGFDGWTFMDAEKAALKYSDVALKELNKKIYETSK